MKKLNNKGFGLVGVLVVIVILAAMGGAGAYVYHKHHKAKATTTSSSTSSNTNSTGKSGNSSGGTQASPKTYTSNDALNLVQTAYTTALTYLKQTTRADQGEIDSIKSSLSTGLYGNLSSNLAKAGHDQILCAQAEPDSLTTSLSSSANGTATIYVNELFGSSVTKVTTTVDLSALKITDISCPQ